MSTKYLLALIADDNGDIYDKCGNVLTDIHNVSIVPGKFKNAIKFSGNSWIQIAHNINRNLGVNTDFTICVWLRYEGGNSYSTILCRWHEYGGGFSASFGGAPNPYCTFGSMSGYRQLISSMPNWSFVDNTWHHICVTRSGNIARLFCDGVKQAEDNMSGYSFDTSDLTNGTVVGTDLFQGNSYLNASLEDLVFISGKALWVSDFSVPLSSLAYQKCLYIQNNKVYGVK